MEAATLNSFRSEFAKRAEWRRDEDELRLEAEWERLRREKAVRHAHELDESHDALVDMAVAAVFATDRELQSFKVEVDAYKPATIEALMENEEQLAAVRKELNGLLGQAYVLPDGRRVFKTEDGTRVFDEHGVEAKDIDPDTIEEWRPRWEQYRNPFEREADLTRQRQDILEFQKLTDDIDAEVAHAEKNGGMTRERLDELRRKLAEEVPDAVKNKMAKDGPAPDTGLDAPRADATFRPIGKLDMPAL